MHQNSELNAFANISFFWEITSNWPNNLLGINVYKTNESCW